MIAAGDANAATVAGWAVAGLAFLAVGAGGTGAAARNRHADVTFVAFRVVGAVGGRGHDLTRADPVQADKARGAVRR